MLLAVLLYGSTTTIKGIWSAYQVWLLALAQKSLFFKHRKHHFWCLKGNEMQRWPSNLDAGKKQALEAGGTKG
ncbi:unnamed protein product [Urochloa humidicola]